MTKEREALKLALHDIERYQTKRQDFDRFENTLIKIKEALAQPEQEPLTEWLVCPKCSYKSPYSPLKAATLAEDAERITKQTRAALAQPKREWVGLTGEEQALVASVSFDVYDAVHRINAKLKEKNHDI